MSARCPYPGLRGSKAREAHQTRTQGATGVEVGDGVRQVEVGRDHLGVLCQHPQLAAEVLGLFTELGSPALVRAMPVWMHSPDACVDCRDGTHDCRGRSG